MESGEVVTLPPEYESQYENQQIDSVFKSSADFCYVCSLAEHPTGAGNQTIVGLQTPDPELVIARVRSAESPPQVVVPVKAVGENRIFRKPGDYWELRFGGKSVHVRDSRGIRYLAELLRCPDQDVHTFQLLRAEVGQTEAITLGSAGPILDEKAIQEYKLRRQTLKEEVAKAERNEDIAGKEGAEEEIGQIEEEIAKAFGIGGRRRSAGDDAERVRKGVSNAINRAIDAIREHHSKLADHLDTHLKRGMFCCYRGDGVDWEL